MDRRRFIRCTSAGAIAAVGIGQAVNGLWSQVAFAREGLLRSDDRILVVLQLSGGNDGLNTVIPFADDEYQKNRLTLAYGAGEVLKIDPYMGWHPSARGLANLFEAGTLSIIQGVGYPNPNRSHFESMDLWHTAHGQDRATGWLGRFADQRSNSLQQEANSVYVGGGVRPLALQARQSVALTVRQLDQFRIQGGEQTKDVAAQLAAVSSDDSDLGSLVASNLRAALSADEKLAEALRRQKGADYRGAELGRDLKQVATMIRAGIGAAVYYVTLDGFDTHANQRGAHASLLDQLGGALQSFCDDLVADQLLDRVLVMCFSEFGRRVKENGSQGTDHGVAGPMFVAGGSIQGGLYGAHPSLTDLDDGDLKHAIDYRSVYRTVLEDWLGASVNGLVDGQFEKLESLIA